MIGAAMRKGGVGLSLIAASLLTQGAQAAPTDATEEDPPSKVAVELIARGKKEYAAGRQLQAYDALRAAWAVYKSPKLACLLGQVEVDLDRHRDAAEHLTTCASRYPLPKRGSEDLARAKSHIVTLEVSAPDGARVRVDAVTMGVAPLPVPLFFEPGEHELIVQLDGFEPHIEVLRTSAGDSLEKRIGLKPLAEKPATPQPAAPAVTKEAQAEPSSGPSVKTLTLISGGVLALGFVTAGVVYRLNASSREDDRQRLRSQLDSDSACYNSTSALCQDLSEAQRDYVDFTTTSNVMFGIGAGFAVLTVGAYFLWPDSQPTSARGVGRRVGLAIGPRGLTASGTF